MGPLAFLIIAALLVIGLVAWLRRGILTGTPPVRVPDVTVDLDTPTIVDCNGTFRGELAVEARYPAPPPEARDPVEVTLAVMPADVTMTLSATMLTFRDDDTARLAFNGRLNDPCRSGSFFVQATVRATRATRTVRSRDGNVATSGFAITEDVPGEALLGDDGVSFTYTFTVRCCAAMTGTLEVRTGNAERVIIRDTDTTPSSFECRNAGETVAVTIRGRKTEEGPGRFVALIRDVSSGDVVCLVGLVRVE